MKTRTGPAEWFKSMARPTPGAAVAKGEAHARAARRRGARAAALAVAAMAGLAGNHRQAASSTVAETRDAGWPQIGHDATEANYSPLDQIDDGNVAQLGLAWSLDIDDNSALEATPLEVGGVLYFTGHDAKVYAVDAVAGKLLWTYDPESWKVDPDRLRLNFSVNRGVAYDGGRIFVGTFDGRLVALDARTGKVGWTVQTFDLATRKYSTGAPRVFRGKVIIGNGGGDYGERGYVTAYDQKTGRQVWRFYTVPGNPADGFENDAMRMAAKTWSGEWWKVGTGGTVWNGITYDPDLNRIYLGVGNSGPYDPALRNPGGGDNLFIASIVALDADTGRYIWHYQVNPNESWDHKASANMVMATIPIDGKPRRVLMQAPSTGFFYVLDRETGKLLSAEKIGKVTWADHIDLKTGRPVEAPNIRFENGPVTIWPSSYGAHSWQAMGYSPKTGLAYIPYMQLGERLSRLPGSTLGGMRIDLLVADKDDGKGKLIAWDPVTQTKRWSVDRVSMLNGGTMPTGGNLVFQGTEDGRLQAVDATTGKLRWSFATQLAVMASPMTYMIGGKQYVSVLTGYGASGNGGAAFLKGGWKFGAQPRRLLTFALGGRAVLPKDAPQDFSVHPLDDPRLVIDEAAATRGATAYMARGCAVCHGMNVRATAMPDLRESAVALDEGAFTALLRGGELAAQGMPRYADLGDDEVRALHMYIRAAARHPDKPPIAAATIAR